MNRPEDALVPLVAVAVLMQMLAATPLRVDGLIAAWETPKVPFVQAHTEPAHTEPEAPPPPRAAAIRDADDHFAGAS